MNGSARMTHARGHRGQLGSVGGPGGHKTSGDQSALVALFGACKVDKTRRALFVSRRSFRPSARVEHPTALSVAGYSPRMCVRSASVCTCMWVCHSARVRIL